MNAVGKLRGYISRSVYIVSGPFHPFGGAVDIIVVEQPDGSFKSSPWYVRFGKFQGVLQAREKLVTVSVNGVEADFHMYLDHKGEAYFLREIDVEAPDIPLSLPSSGEDTDGGSHSRRPMKSASCNYESVTPEKTMSKVNSRGSRILGGVVRREDGFSEENNGSGVVRTDSLERAEIAADLLEVKWSTGLVSSRQKKNGTSRLTSLDMSVGNDINKLKPDIQNVVQSHTHGAATHDIIADNLKDSFMLREIESADDAMGQSFLSIMAESKGYVEESGTESLVLGSKHAAVTSIVEAERPATMEVSSENENLRVDDVDTIFPHVANGPELVGDPSDLAENGISRTFPLMPTFQPLLGSAEVTESESPFTISTFRNSTCQPLVDINTSNAGKICDTQLALDHDSPSLVITGDTFRSTIQKSGDSEEDLLFGDLDDFREIKTRRLKDPISQDHERDTQTETPVSQTKTDPNEFSMPNHVYSLSAEMFAHKDLPVNAENFGIKLKTMSSEINFSSSSGFHSEEVRAVRSLPNMWISDSDISGFDKFIEHTLNSEYVSSEYKFPRQDDLNNVEAKAEIDHQPSKSPQLMEDAETNQELKNGSGHLIVGNSSRPVDASSGNWRIWPFSFKRSRSMEISESDLGFNRSSGAERKTAIEDERDILKVKKLKKKVRENTPSSEQLASLKLKEGRNTLTFTFSTPMLGKQQVDAQIHLWKWDTRIVISDVDGTITRSDLLGQVMPLVGVDWSQTGVASLFSAIKENGYHVLFLSARAISQSYLTRQLLFNLKQDGKALPEGPIVISPDGLFPSLYREVVRRAPHEFKISCLEAIKALFPSDRNPFYAGFGNRDSDEISYLKVGIPRGKIFIINPKGEIIVNHRVDRKSYTSFHALVNDMFPLMSSSGQEDYNSWNYWKLPLPPIDS